MRRATIVFACLILWTELAPATGEHDGDSVSTIVALNKEQLGALSAAIRHMQRIGRSYKGQQVRIWDKGETFHVAFMEDPIDVRVVGNQNGAAWEIRKRDFKVLRKILVR